MPLQLRLRSWQTHADVALTSTRPVVLVAGPNASGKTALLDGVELALLGTGKLRGVATKTDLAAKAIRDDAQETQVFVAWPGFSVERTMDRNADQVVTLNGTPYKVKRGDAKIREALGLEPEQLRAALEADHLLEGDEKSRRRTLFQASGAEASRDQIAVALEETQLPGEDIGRLMDLAVDDGFADAQRYAEGQRAARTSRLREPPVERPDPRFFPDWIEKEIRLDEVSLEDLQTRETELEDLLGKARKQAGINRGELEEKLRAAKERHAALVAEGIELSERQVDDLAALQAQAEAAVGLHEEALQTGQKLADRVSALEAQAKLLEDLEIEKPDVCPAIPGEPKCPMTPKRLQAHRQKLEESREKILSDLETARVAKDEYQETQTDRLGAEAQRLQSEVTKAEEIAERLGEIHSEVDDEETTIAEIEAKLRAPDPEPRMDREADLQTRLANLRKLIEEKRSYDTACSAAVADTAQRQAKETERSRWDAAAKLLSPGGIPSRLFGAQVPMLQDFIDEFGIAEIRVTPDVALEARVEGRWRARTQLSESWRLRLSMAASHMVARTAGFPLLILDRFDHLDPEGRQAVMEGARRVAPHYLGGVLILATPQRRPVPTGFPDVETFWLHQGQLERVG